MTPSPAHALLAAHITAFRPALIRAARPIARDRYCAEDAVQQTTLAWLLSERAWSFPEFRADVCSAAKRERPGPAVPVANVQGEDSEPSEVDAIDHAFFRAAVGVGRAAGSDPDPVSSPASPWAVLEATLAFAPPDPAVSNKRRRYLRGGRRMLAVAAARRGPNPLWIAKPSDALYGHGARGTATRTEAARDTLIAACDDACAAIELHAGCLLPSPAAARGTPSAHKDGRRSVFWACTDAALFQKEHADAAAEEVPRVARAFSATGYAAPILAALRAAKRRGFPIENLPLAMADRLGFIPGRRAPIAWALLEIAAGLAPSTASEIRGGVTAWERKRAEVWRKRLHRAAVKIAKRAPARNDAMAAERVCA